MNSEQLIVNRVQATDTERFRTMPTGRQASRSDSITAKQIKKIKTLQGKLKMPDEDYRLLLSDYWVNTCKDLQYEDAEALIKRLEAQALTKGVWSRYSHRGKMRYEHLGERQGMASPKQLRMIESMWKDVSYRHDSFTRQKALRHFVFRITGKSDMAFLESGDVQKLVSAMGAMRYRSTDIRPQTSDKRG